jgi:uncharacterized iron-regulated membrane protein
MTSWWWPGFLIELALFLLVVFGIMWLLLERLARHLDRHLDEMEERRIMFEEVRRQHEDAEPEPGAD